MTEHPAEAVDLALVDAIIDRHGVSGTLISILTDVQKQCSYLPRPALERIAERLEVPFSQVYGVSTFYKIFSLTPRGKHSLKVCLGTACHVKGAGLILDRLKRDLEVEEGGTTADGRFTLETVRCVGCCSIAPVVMVNETAYGQLKQEALPKIVEKYGNGSAPQDTAVPEKAATSRRKAAPRTRKPAAASTKTARKKPAARRPAKGKGGA